MTNQSRGGTRGGKKDGTHFLSNLPHSLADQLLSSLYCALTCSAPLRSEPSSLPQIPSAHGVECQYRVAESWTGVTRTDR